MKKCTYCNKNFLPRIKRYTLCSKNCYRKLMIAENAPRSKTNVCLKGEENPYWKNNKSDDAKRRKFFDTVREEVLLRDDHTCQRCGEKSAKPHIDHIETWKQNPELRSCLSNCRTLCIPCHYYVTYGREMPIGSGWGFGRLRANN